MYGWADAFNVNAELITHLFSTELHSLDEKSSLHARSPKCFI